MQISGYKRRKRAGFAYPPIPARDQYILSDGTANEQSSIRILHGMLALLRLRGSIFSALTKFLLSVSSSRDSSPADAFRAESVTHTNKENEQFVRDRHSSLSSQAGVYVTPGISAYFKPRLSRLFTSDLPAINELHAHSCSFRPRLQSHNQYNH